MKKITYFILILITVFNCNKEVPTKFSVEALNDTFLDLEGNAVAFKNILAKHKEKTIVIDIWASWCGDCIKGMPKVKVLQKDHKDAVYIFLSLDRGVEAWKKGIEKYDVRGEHYYLPSGKDSAFGDFVNIDWIPRYMVVDATGNIKLFRAVEADDKRIIEIL
ncbi:redoxin [Pseudalgibacter alginicilyticus]|uniref:Redoxin n=1 Tax=Pseudalgibacter alginicilyticus TaxID=1736674 RepID=A0A0P0D729_9FLAO|nr:TlpA disulfide reductase family protein [Pseudalgibacter alginicilyticus]ALJ04527.1 redoxin [Pseudalgibacter alginicilyticus]